MPFDKNQDLTLEVNHTGTSLPRFGVIRLATQAFFNDITDMEWEFPQPPITKEGIQTSIYFVIRAEMLAHYPGDDDMEQLARLHLVSARLTGLLSYFHESYEPIEFVIDCTAK